MRAITMDTGGLPVAEQFAAWARHSVDTRLAPGAPGPFLATGAFWDLGPVHLADVALDPFTSERDAPRVNATGSDHVQLVALREGAVRFRAEGIDQRLAAPDLFVRDYAGASWVSAGRIRARVVYFARDYLTAAAGLLAGVQGALPWSPEAAVLYAALDALALHLPDAEPGSAGHWAQSLRGLTAAALLRGWGRAGPTSRPGDDRLARARRHLAGRPPGPLRPDAVAAELGLSRSVLFALFRPHGGVVAFDRMQRLRALHRVLADPAERRPLAELGPLFGFPDPPALSRAFRRAFGYAPVEARAGAAAPPSADPAGQIRRLVNRLT